MNVDILTDIPILLLYIVPNIFFAYIVDFSFTVWIIYTQSLDIISYFRSHIEGKINLKSLKRNGKQGQTSKAIRGLDLCNRIRHYYVSLDLCIKSALY